MPVMANICTALGSSTAFASNALLPLGKLTREVTPNAESAVKAPFNSRNRSVDSLPGLSGSSMSLKA